MPPSHAQKRRLVKYFLESIDEHPDWPVILTEGDSWFSFPLHANTIDFLDEKAGRKISLLRLERSGDELLTILSGKQRVKLRLYLTRDPIQALLLSGGGNDIAGRDLYHLLRQKTAANTWEQCIDKARVSRRIQQLELAYRDVIDIRNDVRPACRIYLHGYDYAIPSGKASTFFGLKVGPWLQPNLEDRGITDPDDQRNIVRWLMDRFNEMLQGIAQASSVVHVDLRGTLGAGDWHDELHPKRAGFDAVASKFAAKLNDQFPGKFS